MDIQVLHVDHLRSFGIHRNPIAKAQQGEYGISGRLHSVAVIGGDWKAEVIEASLRGQCDGNGLSYQEEVHASRYDHDDDFNHEPDAYR